MARMLGRGVPGWTLWQEQQMKPSRPAPRVSRQWRTSRRTSSGVPRGRANWLSTPPWKRRRAVRPLQASHVHAWADMLDRVEHVDAAAQERFNERFGGAVGVVKHPQAVRVDQLAPALQTRLEVAMPQGRRHEQTRLPGDVVADKGQVVAHTAVLAKGSPDFGRVPEIHRQAVDRLAVEHGQDAFLWLHNDDRCSMLDVRFTGSAVAGRCAAPPSGSNHSATPTTGAAEARNRWHPPTDCR